jgi:hypothetical protein
LPLLRLIAPFVAVALIGIGIVICVASQGNYGVLGLFDWLYGTDAEFRAIWNKRVDVNTVPVVDPYQNSQTQVLVDPTKTE